MGRGEEATALFERLLGFCNDLGLIAEEYDPASRRMLGNFPQAFSHIALDQLGAQPRHRARAGAGAGGRRAEPGVSGFLEAFQTLTWLPRRAHIRCNRSETAPMFIQTESTPNPATLKFLPGRTVMAAGTADFPGEEAAQASPLARRIFATGDVTGVFFGPDFVTVTKAEGVDWAHIKPGILGAIMEHFQSGQPVIEGEAGAVGHAAHSGEDAEIVGQIKELLDTRVRPAVAQDGGDITFHGFDRGVVYLHMQGACAGCPSSTMTLKMGIENLLRHYIPEVTEVRPVGL